MSKHCKGCATYYGPHGRGDCNFIKFNQEGACPCSLCIVKTMCVDQCDKYRVWVNAKVDTLNNG